MESLSKILELTGAEGSLCLDSYGQFILPGKRFQPMSFTHCTQCVCVNGKPENCLSMFCEPPENCNKSAILQKKGSCCEFICLKNKNNLNSSYFNSINSNKLQKLEKLSIPFHNLGIGIGIGNGNLESGEVKKKAQESKPIDKQFKSRFLPSLNENLLQAGRKYGIYGAIINNHGSMYNQTKNELNKLFTLNELMKNQNLNRNYVFYHNVTNQNYNMPNLNSINRAIWFAGQNNFRLLACASLLFFILAFIFFFIQQMRQRRLFFMFSDSQTRPHLNPTLNHHRCLQSNFLSRVCLVEHPPPYTFWKPLSSNLQINDSGELPPPYKEVTQNSSNNFNNLSNNLDLNLNNNNVFECNNLINSSTPVNQQQINSSQISFQSIHLPSSSEYRLPLNIKTINDLNNQNLDLIKAQRCTVNIPSDKNKNNINIEPAIKSKDIKQDYFLNQDTNVYVSSKSQLQIDLNSNNLTRIKINYE